MNKRIRELAEQLGYNVDFEPSDDETDRSYQVISNDFAEKFAELIVRECADIAKHNVMNISTYSDAEFVSDLIHQNFGVK